MPHSQKNGRLCRGSYVINQFTYFMITYLLLQLFFIKSNMRMYYTKLYTECSLDIQFYFNGGLPNNK